MTSDKSALTRQVGGFRVTAIQDGQMTGSVALMPDFDDAQAQAYCDRVGVPFSKVRETSVNCFVIEGQGRTMLVDTGSPPDFHKDAGRFPEAFAAAGFKPEDIDILILTHLHVDHWGNMLRREDGEAFFPRAEFVVTQSDYDFIHDESVYAGLNDARKVAHDRSRACCVPYAGRTRLIADDGDIVPGISYVTMPGHSPGHSGVLIQSAGTVLFIFADLAHAWFWQAPFPDWSVLYDLDQKQAARSRRATLARIVAEGWPCAGMHTPFPGWARVEQDGDVWRILPDF
ncbi:MBL fold metallo-hydrolase [Pseudooceanicola sp.]|uniref:MBL fold metallo-hydrolase n=1 Tax=Pseudooceanicola sp. TaxID=1914328 RepID=UPI0026068FFE|nr:MBL fold metallo-hydrolase [Pseudooceanicola sp.]MDF1855566.1 MBL fold metallo-hydrolase [Pseudooceanicola sp.]